MLFGRIVSVGFGSYKIKANVEKSWGQKKDPNLKSPVVQQSVRQRQTFSSSLQQPSVMSVIRGVHL